MAKTRQILKLAECGKKFSVIYHEGSNNPYWIYRHTWGIRQCGVGYAEHKRLEVKYADFYSCLCFLQKEY